MALLKQPAPKHATQSIGKILPPDSLRRDHMSHYGYGRLTTPNISKYADRGITFESCFSAHIPTTPGYSSMLTGRDVFGTGVVALGQSKIVDGVPVEESSDAA